MPCQAVGNSGRRRQVQDAGTQCEKRKAPTAESISPRTRRVDSCVFLLFAQVPSSPPCPPQAALAATAVPSNPEFIQHAHL